MIAACKNTVSATQVAASSSRLAGLRGGSVLCKCSDPTQHGYTPKLNRYAILVECIPLTVLATPARPERIFPGVALVST